MNATCKDRINANYQGRIEDLDTLWTLHAEDPDAYNNDLGNMYEYGLCFDYVAPGTFKDQREGYFRYQLSYGGPSDEFRIYADQAGDYNWSVYKIEYWFLDWFDGAHKTLHGSNFNLLEEIFTSFFVDSGTADKVYNDAMEDYEPPLDEDEDDED